MVALHTPLSLSWIIGCNAEEKHDISLKTYTKQGLNPHDRQRLLESATL